MVAITLLSAALLAAAQAVNAKPVARSVYGVKDFHPVPRGWSLVARAPADHVMTIQIGVKQSNFPELERHLYEVSDPSHPRYGQHLTGDQVNEFVKPSDETHSLVHEWLGDNGIIPESYSAAKDWITVSLPVGAIEQLLDTEYHVFEHEDGRKVARAPSWSLPRHLHSHIDTIQPTNSFFRAKRESFQHLAGGAFTDPSIDPSDSRPFCNISSVAPTCFEHLYNITGYKPQSTCKNKVAFNNFLTEHPIRTDAELFVEKYRPSELSVVKGFPQITIAGGPGDLPLSPNDLENGVGGEANLDIQALAGITFGTPIISYSTGGSPPFIADDGVTDDSNEPYLVWVNWLLSQKSLPQVISTSYADHEQTVPKSYATRVCQQFAQVGARGTSLLFGSGDDGVGAYGTCFTNDDAHSETFLAAFPASCPYVTTVGATKAFDPEVVAYRPAFVDEEGGSHGNYTSGGGFSYYFEAPGYQKAVVDKYVAAMGETYKGLYNPKGRAYPDISAQGLYFAYFYNGTESVISGTSASTPLMSGILALINDARLAAGKSSLGFLNPWIYSVGYKGFRDVTAGSAVGCGVDGFPALEGWDAVTGFGTPDFPELVKLSGGKLN